MKTRPRVVVFALAAAAAAVSAQLPAPHSAAFAARVVKVLDGDSLVVLRGAREVEVRLHGVDAPEGRQAYGSTCRRTLANLVDGKAVTVQVMDIDRYRRSVSRVSADGRDVGLILIQSGCAWHYLPYSTAADYAAAELDARRARRGLWQDSAPVAPWTFRQPRSPAPPAPPSAAPGGRTSGARASGPFRGNVESLIFHAPGCEDYTCRHCTAVFAGREAAVAAGYRPHEACAGR